MTFDQRGQPLRMMDGQAVETLPVQTNVVVGIGDQREARIVPDGGSQLLSGCPGPVDQAPLDLDPTIRSEKLD